MTQYKGYLECVPSGSLDYGISPKEQIIHELHEETAIVESDLDKITLLGLFYSVSSRTFDLGYEIYLKTQKNVDASKEYSSIQWIEDSSMRQMCLAHSRIVPLSRCLLQSRRTS